MDGAITLLYLLVLIASTQELIAQLDLVDTDTFRKDIENWDQTNIVANSPKLVPLRTSKDCTWGSQLLGSMCGKERSRW